MLVIKGDWQDVVDVVARRETERCSETYGVNLPPTRELQHCTIDLPVVTVI
jgi:hypothetical protein